jgi:hypothetical protein
VNWADGEPNNWEEQDCVQLLPPWGHKWDDDFCNYQKKAICEKKGWKERIIAGSAEICRRKVKVQKCNKKGRNLGTRFVDGQDLIA